MTQLAFAPCTICQRIHPAWSTSPWPRDCDGINAPRVQTPAAYVIGRDVICAPCVANHGTGIDLSKPMAPAPWYPGRALHRCAVCAGPIR